MSETGYVEAASRPSIHCFDWVIQDYKALVSGEFGEKICGPPSIFDNGLEFGLKLRSIPDDEKRFNVCLKNYSEKDVDVALCSLHLVGRDERVFELWSKSSFAIKKSHMRRCGDALIAKTRIGSKFLTNGDLRIRFQLINHLPWPQFQKARPFYINKDNFQYYNNLALR